MSEGISNRLTPPIQLPNRDPQQELDRSRAAVQAKVVPPPKADAQDEEFREVASRALRE
jgi:hypothetical protein